MKNNIDIDFFLPECQTANIKATDFGICDSADKSVKKHAFVDYDNPGTWIAHVRNRTNKALTFTAIDNCIAIYRENGEIDFRCDAMLTNAENIVFIELKSQRRDWIQHAVWEQLWTTIKHFCENNDLKKYKHCRAFVCNRRHPNFDYSNKELMHTFFQRTGVRLNIQSDIVFEV